METQKFSAFSGCFETYSEHFEKSFAIFYEGDKIEIDVYDETVTGFYIKETIKNAKEMLIDSKVVKVASITDLTIMKLKSATDRMGSANGEKDLSDLLAILNKYH